MQEIARSDLFFMITSLVVLLIGAVLIVLLGYVLKITRDISRITSVIKEESELIKEDIDDARREIKEKSLLGIGIFSVIKTVTALFMKGKKFKNKK